jgi:hypothetical protein
VYFDDLQRIFKGFRIHGIYFADEVMKWMYYSSLFYI